MTSVEDPAGRRVGPYRLRAMLGQGGMGVVHRALDDRDREVALKLLRPELAKDATFHRRLAREVETMRRVRSPHVAEVLDADLSGERPYIVTRFIDGRPLDDWVRDAGPLSGGPLGRVAAGLADALSAIHDAGVIHRDLKPNNVMLVDGAPVLIDFGIAHLADATRLTRTGVVVGTPGYMGPEVIGGAPPGPAQDIFGWAATVTYAATGRSPFGGGAIDAVLARILAGGPDLDGVPSRLEPFLREALDHDPERRPSARQLSEWVRDADLGAPVAPTGVVRTVAERPPRDEPGKHPPPVPAERPPPAAPEQTRARTGHRVPLGVYKLPAYLLIVALAAAGASLPVPVVTAMVLAAAYLRAGDHAVRSRVPVGDVRDLLLAPVRRVASLARSLALVVPSLAYAGLVAGLAGVVLFVGGGIGDHVPIASLSAFVFGYVTLAGPGTMGPRRQLVRFLSALATDRRTVVAVAVVSAVLAVPAVYGAWFHGPHWWPLTGAYRRLGQLLDLLSSHLWHL